MTKRLFTIALTLMCALFSSTCGGGGSGAPPGATPDFTISVNPGTISGSAGGNSGATSITITGLNGFTGNVIVSIGGLNILPGATTTPPQPFAIAAGASQSLTIGIPAAAAQGNVALTLTGTAGLRSHSVALVLSVGPTPGPDFSIAANPSTVAATPGGSSAPANISIAGSNGFAGNVSVNLTGLPAGATTSPAQPFSIAAGATQAVTINVPVTTAPGSVGLSVTGTSGQLAHSTSLVLNVGSVAAGSDQIVVVGQTNSTNFPTTPGAHSRTLSGSGDGVIASVRLASGVASTTFSTYFGGNAGEEIRDTFVDAQGNIYITGQTSSTNFPTTPGAVQRTFAGGLADAFVTKFSPSGQLLASTYIGGNGHDEGYNIFVDSAGAVYVGGRTSSADYPVTGGQIPQRVYGGGTYDMHVTRLSADLSTIVWATFLGGNGEDTGRGRLALDGSGNIYMSGETRSNNFPGAAGQLSGLRDGVLVKLSPNGALLYTRLIGGNEGNSPEGLSGSLLVKSSGESYVCGFSSATDVPGVIRPFGGGAADALIARLDSGGQILAITYLGGNGIEECQGLALDSSGDLLVATLTSSSMGFPTTAGAFQTNPQGGTDYAFTKFSPDLSQIRFSTRAGGSGNEDADTLRLELDSAGNLYFAGHTTSSGLSWITANAVQSNFAGGSHDFVVFVLSADGRQMLYATYWGGNGIDIVRSMRYRRNP